MVISSMTGYTTVVVQDDFGTLTWVIKTLNHRYLDIGLKLPPSLEDIQPTVRELIKRFIKRGKADVSLEYQPGQALPFEWQLNSAMMAQLKEVMAPIQAQWPTAQLDLLQWLAWPGVLQVKPTRTEALQQQALSSLENALHDCVTVRQREGATLQTFMQLRLDLLQTELAAIESRLPMIIEAYQARLTARLEGLVETIEPTRLAQEAALWVQRSDVSEECQRIAVHITEVKRLLSDGGVVGRRLDFMMQELTREVNTLSSKSIDPQMSQSGIEMKVLIEQMREQVQNIE